MKTLFSQCACGVHVAPGVTWPESPKLRGRGMVVGAIVLAASHGALAALTFLPYGNRPRPAATGGNRCTRGRLAGRLRDPETSILPTPLAKSTKTNLQEEQIRETVVTFRSPRALNCELVLTFSLFWTPPLCGKREKCDTLLTFQCLTLWTHVFYETFASLLRSSILCFSFLCSSSLRF